MTYKGFGLFPEAQAVLQSLGFTEAAEPDLAIVCGGDGSFLQALREFSGLKKFPLLLLIHNGSLGYWADFYPEDFRAVLSELKAGTCATAEFSLLEITTAGETHLAFNEFALIDPVRAPRFTLRCKDAVFESFRASGLVIATPQGSTGLNKSLGGPLVDPALPAYIVTKLAPLSNKITNAVANALVLSGREPLSVSLAGGAVTATVDGAPVAFSGEAGLAFSNKRVKIVVQPGIDFGKRLARSFKE